MYKASVKPVSSPAESWLLCLATRPSRLDGSAKGTNRAKSVTNSGGASLHHCMSVGVNSVALPRCRVDSRHTPTDSVVLGVGVGAGGAALRPDPRGAVDGCRGCCVLERELRRVDACVEWSTALSAIKPTHAPCIMVHASRAQPGSRNARISRRRSMRSKNLLARVLLPPAAAGAGPYICSM
jgi:hypothetical protein